ncbi:MAG: RNA polymerase II mediator complex subunit [Trizodia sp. TS-e1964]|nr:MAG: RNA polymerase II mediator complex subunit [Trizodia sp. TS-e1964]
MADRITQLQTTLDQLATQFYACIRYIATHHSAAPTSGTEEILPPAGADDLHFSPVPLTSDAPADFLAAQRELARDLVLKVAQINILVDSLPGLGKNESVQVDRLRELDVLFKAQELERAKVVKDREEVLASLDAIITKARRI